MRSVHVLLIALAMLALVSCGTPGAPMPPSLELPQPVSDPKATRKADKVTLTWSGPTETTDQTAIKHPGKNLICRSITETVISRCDHPIGTMTFSPGTVPGPGTFFDTLSKQVQDEHPAGFATYALESQNDRGRSAGFSNQVRVTTAPTLPPPPDFRSQLTPEGPVLLWNGRLQTSGVPELDYFFRVYRRTEGAPSETVVGEVELRNQPQVELPDRTFEWEKTYFYRLTVVTTVTQGNRVVAEVEGPDSPPLKVFAHDIFPPAVPTGLQAVFSGLEQQRFIDLTWAPDTDADLAGYNVYRHVGGTPPQKINSELVKTPSFRDTQVQPGTTYDYSVSAVDLRGNESGRSEEAHETVPQ